MHRVSRIALLLIAPLILLLSLMRTPPGPTFAHSDKILHLLAYGVLGLFAYLSLGRGGFIPFLLAVGLCSLYGGVIELLQHLVYRSPELGDWIADVVGAGCGALLAAGIHRLLVRNRDSSVIPRQ